jgi:hypothetical protein
MAKRPVVGVETQLGPDTVRVQFPLLHMYEAWKQFGMDADADHLIAACMKGNIFVAARLGACGLGHLALYSDKRITEILDNNEDQILPFCAAVGMAFGEGYVRQLPDAQRAALAAKKNDAPPTAPETPSQPPTSVQPTGGPTSTSSSNAVDGSGSTQT